MLEPLVSLPSVVPAGVVLPAVVSVPVGSTPVVPSSPAGTAPPRRTEGVGSPALAPALGAATEVARGETVSTARRTTGAAFGPADLDATVARVVDAVSSATCAIVTPRGDADAAEASPPPLETSANAIRSTKPGSGTERPDALNSGIGRTTAANSPASARRPSGRSTSTRDTRSAAKLVATDERWSECEMNASPDGVAHPGESPFPPAETHRLLGDHAYHETGKQLTDWLVEAFQ